MGTDDQAPRGTCRFCKTPLRHTVVDLGMSPLCESYLTADRLNEMEPFYPLHLLVCHECWLVQLDEYVSAEQIFSEYAYFSSYSAAWLEHARSYVEMITQRLGLDERSLVVELASNDGYLLQYFRQRGVPVLGIEPAVNVAQVALDRGIDTLVQFFGADAARELTAQGKVADLIVANNVLAQVPDLHSFVEGMSILLGPRGIITIEVPHLLQLLRQNQFDTIYHEHFSYFSLLTVERILEAHGLQVFDVEELWTHGGSLRIYARHVFQGAEPAASVQELRRRELDAGLTRVGTYTAFEEQVRETKRKLLAFLIEAKRAGKRVAAYGAPGKGNTLLNYCGIRTDFIDFTVDRNPYKQGRYLPGTHIPILAPERLDEARPDYVLILPWNVKDEILAQLAHARAWGAQFVVPIPQLEVIA